MDYDVIAYGNWLEFCKIGHYEFFNRYKKPRAVTIFATTANKELIAVEQVRVPHGQPVLEAPAGLVDGNESYFEAAKRELLEETGYGDGEILYAIENITTSPGICTEVIDIVMMANVKKIGEGGGLAEENEHIKIHLIPVNNIDNYLNDISRNILLDMKLLASLYYARLHCGF